MFSGGVQHPEVTAVFSIAVSHRLLVKQEEKEEEELDSRGGEGGKRRNYSPLA